MKIATRIISSNLQKTKYFRFYNELNACYFHKNLLQIVISEQVLAFLKCFRFPLIQVPFTFEAILFRSQQC